MKKEDKDFKNIVQKKAYSSPNFSNKPRGYKKKVQSLPTGLFPKQAKKEKKALNRAQIIQQKNLGKLNEQIYCTPNQNAPLFLLGTLLKRKKIENLQVKELLIAMRNFKQLTNELQKSIYNHSHRMTKQGDKESNPFLELLEKREERHFQIDRIIRYLSEV